MGKIGIRARVVVCTDPLLGGVGEALKWERLDEIIEMHRGMTRLFLLLVDRDCDDSRAARLRVLEQRAAHPSGVVLIVRQSRNIFPARRASKQRAPRPEVSVVPAGECAGGAAAREREARSKQR